MRWVKLRPAPAVGTAVWVVSEETQATSVLPGVGVAPRVTVGLATAELLAADWMIEEAIGYPIVRLSTLPRVV
jgi:hypothetical protein